LVTKPESNSVFDTGKVDFESSTEKVTEKPANKRILDRSVSSVDRMQFRKKPKNVDMEPVRLSVGGETTADDIFRLEELEKRESTKHYKRDKLSSLMQHKALGARPKVHSFLQKSS